LLLLGFGAKSSIVDHVLDDGDTKILVSKDQLKEMRHVKAESLAPRLIAFKALHLLDVSPDELEHA